MSEIWKEIKGDRETYEISNYGNVRTKDRVGSRGYFVKGRLLTKYENSNGYLRVSMNIDGKSKLYLIHRLVAQYFVENLSCKNYVNHKDGNKQNNNYKNLEWCTRSENEQHAWRLGLKTNEKCSHPGELHPRHKLTQEQVDYIRKVHKPFDKEYGSKALGKKFNVRGQTITDIVHYRTWIETLPLAELITGE